MDISQIRVGARCHFVPGGRLRADAVHSNPRSRDAVVGRIVYVNYAHRFFRVEYPTGKGQTLSECFKF